MTWYLLTLAFCGTALIRPAWTTRMPGKRWMGRREQPCLSRGMKCCFLSPKAVMELCHCINMQLKWWQSGGLSNLEVKVCFLFPDFFPWNVEIEVGFLISDCAFQLCAATRQCFSCAVVHKPCFIVSRQFISSQGERGFFFFFLEVLK